MMVQLDINNGVLANKGGFDSCYSDWQCDAVRHTKIAANATVFKKSSKIPSITLLNKPCSS